MLNPLEMMSATTILDVLKLGFFTLSATGSCMKSYREDIPSNLQKPSNCPQSMKIDHSTWRFNHQAKFHENLQYLRQKPSS
jgi:hypothetical protein